MRGHNERTEAERIDLYWDAVSGSGSLRVFDETAVEIEPSIVETISRITKTDNAHGPAPEFMTRFEAELLEVLTSASVPPAPPERVIPLFEKTRPGRVIELPARRNGRRNVLLSFAAAILLFISLAGSYYLLVERNGDTSTADQENVIPAPPNSIDVPTDRGNVERTGVMPGPGVSDGLELRWNLEAGQGAISAPAIAGDTIFVTTGSDINLDSGNPGSVIAIDALSGTERWRFPTDHAAGTTPAVAGGIVYAGDTGGVFYALDAVSGEELWRTDLQNGWTSAPAVLGDTVYVAAAPYRAPLHVAVRGDTVVVGSGLVGQATDDVKLYAFDRLTGEERWPSTDFLSGQPGLFAFDAENGAPSWTFGMPSLESGPAISGQRVYAGSTLDGTMYSLDLASGDELWHVAIAEDLPLDSSPAVSDGSVFITTAFGNIICIDESSGEERWRASAEHISVNGSAIVVDDTVYVVDTAYGVSALSAGDGAVLWSEQLDLTGQVVDSPVVQNGRLFIVTSLEGEAAHVATLWAFAGSSGIDSDARESS